MPRKLISTVFALLLTLVGSLPTLAQEKSASLNFADYMLPLEDYRLDNGLRVILARDDSAPVVAVNLTYHVGGANDPKGRSGFAHLFEHMMFYGSAHVKQGEFDKYLTEIGADFNAYTADDKTVYYATAPATELPRILWLESDRMGSLIVDQQAFDTERQVVIEEYNQRVANAAYGVATRRFDVLPFLGYPPYERPTIGNVADLNAATLDDVQNFHETYYVPNNATLVIVGDIDVAQTKLLVQAYFDRIAAGPSLPSILTQYPLPAHFPTLRSDAETSCQIGYEETIIDPRAELPRLFASVVTTSTPSLDAAALGLLGSILGGGESSRFQQRLVRAGKAASAFAGLNESRLGVDVMQFGITPNPGAPITQTYPLLRTELQDVIEHGVTAQELARAKQQTVLDAITNFRGNVADTAEWLQDAVLHYDDPSKLPAEVARYQAVTLDDIQRVAKTYLCERPLNLVTVLKEGQPITATAPALTYTPPTLPPGPRDELPPGVVNRYSVPASLPSTELSVPSFITFTLANGLKVIVVEEHKTPEVNLSLYVGGSDTALPADKQGAAQLMAALITKGTTTRSAEELASTIEGVGGSLSASALSELTGVFASGPSTDTSLVFDLLADVTLHPTFPEDQFTVERDRALANMKFDTSNPNTLASRQFNRAIYPGHPYSFYRTPATVNGLTTKDLVDFYQKFYHPGNALLVIVGDLTDKTARDQAERVFGEWSRAETPDFLHYPSVSRPMQPTIYLVDRPDSEQSSVRIGNLALRANDPQRYAFEVGNTVLGGSGLGSRLNKNLREAKGYTYGVYSGFTQRQDQGAFVVSGDVGTAATGDAVKEIMHELSQIRSTGVTTSELAEGQGMLVGEFTMSIADPASLAQQLAVRSLHGIPLDEIRNHVAAIEAVTGSEVISAARANIDVQAPVIVVVGDAKQVLPQLQQLGPVTQVDANGAVIEVAPQVTATVTSGSNAAVNACIANCQQPASAGTSIFATEGLTATTMPTATEESVTPTPTP